MSRVVAGNPLSKLEPENVRLDIEDANRLNRSPDPGSVCMHFNKRSGFLKAFPATVKHGP